MATKRGAVSVLGAPSRHPLRREVGPLRRLRGDACLSSGDDLIAVVFPRGMTSPGPVLLAPPPPEDKTRSPSEAAGGRVPRSMATAAAGAGRRRGPGSTCVLCPLSDPIALHGADRVMYSSALAAWTARLAPGESLRCHFPHVWGPFRPRRSRSRETERGVSRRVRDRGKDLFALLWVGGVLRGALPQLSKAKRSCWTPLKTDTMSESIVRKIQPFTIGTKLSVPSGPKCPDFEDPFLPTQSLDTCKLQNSLNDQVALYLGQPQIQADSPQLSPTADPGAPGKGQTDDPAREDNPNRNGLSPTSSSRSIRKIAISGGPDSPGEAPLAPGEDCPVAAVTSKPESVNVNNNNHNGNNNNNNPVPRIVGVSCENTPNSHLKVLLRKDVTTEDQRQDDEEGAECKSFGGTTTSVHETSPHRVPLTEERSPRGTSEAPPPPRLIPAHNDCSYAQCNTLFNREVLQAEAWIKGKLQDLKDGWDVQRSPLQDSGEVSQTLQRDLKDFENTLIQLNQMGEQLACAQNPNSDQVKKRLGRLQDQWHALRQTAANQSKALGGARNLQQFNRKADRLETWIKEKQEEERSLAGVLGENVDKIQLTRRILDLKQDELQYRTLHEEINQLALKLEKQGKVEGKNISVRRKHINKMWLKVQSLLKDYHDNLQLALEVSSFYQQADNIISAINRKKKSVPLTNEQEDCGEREIGDIAGQITMLDVTASQLSNLHPTLASRVSVKQSEVKDNWASFQRAVRNERSGLLSADLHFTREEEDPRTSSWDSCCTLEKEAHGIMGKEVKEEQNRLKGCTSVREAGSLTNGQDDEQPPKSRVPVAGNYPDDDVLERHPSEGESEELELKPEAGVSGGDARFCVQLRKSAASAEKTLLWLKDSVAMTTQAWSAPELEGSRLSPQEDVLSCRPKTRKEGRNWHCPEDMGVDHFLDQLEHLWEELRRRHHPKGAGLQHTRKSNRKVMDLPPLEAWLQMAGGSHRQSPPGGVPKTTSPLERDVPRQEGGASQGGRRLQEEVEERYRRVQRGHSQERQHPTRLTGFLDESHGQSLPSELVPDACLRNVPEVRGEAVPMGTGDSLEDLGVAVEILKDTVSEIQPIRELLGQCASLTMRINHALSLGAELSMDVMDAETDMAVKCEPDRSGLQGLQEQQDQMEVEYEALKDEVAEMEKQGACLEALCPEKWPILGEEVQATLQVWEELGRSMAENRGRLQQFGHLQDFFRDYLAMISWTEDTRSCIFSERAKRRGKGDEGPVTSELDLKIQRKFEDFDSLAAAGQKLMEEEHHLAELIKERTEELQSMLGWILVHWRAQKHQQSCGKRKGDDVVSSEVTVPTATEQQDGSPQSQRPSDGQLTSTTSCHDDLQDRQPSGAGHVGTGQKDSGSGSPTGPPESREPPFLVLKEPGAPSLGGTVNLILSFGTAGDSLLQVQNPEEDAETPEPVHRVSTYLRVKDSHTTVAPVDLRPAQEPAQTSAPCSVSSPPPPPPSSSSSSSTSPPQVSSVAFHTRPKKGPAPCLTISPAPCPTISSTPCQTVNSGPSSCTISPTPCATLHPLLQHLQRSEGPEQKQEEGGGPEDHGSGAAGSSRPSRDPVALGTSTWPLQERKKRCTSSVRSTAVEPLALAKRPLVENAGRRCVSQSQFSHAVLPGRLASAGLANNHCRHLSLGSVLSFDLPKDLSLIPSIHDVITISPPGPAGTDRPAPTGRCSPVNQKPATSSSNQIRSPVKSAGTIKLSPTEVKGQTTVQSDCVASRRFDLQASSVSANREAVSLNPKQTLPNDDLLVPQTRAHSGRSLSLCHGPREPRDRSFGVRTRPALRCGRGGAAAPDGAPPRRTVGTVLSLERAEPAPRGRKGGAAASTATDAVRPDHRQFEEEEEELEDIWNQTNGYGQACQPTNQGEAAAEATTATAPPPGDLQAPRRGEGPVRVRQRRLQERPGTAARRTERSGDPGGRPRFRPTRPVRNVRENTPPAAEGPVWRRAGAADGEVCAKVQSVSWLPVCMGAGEKAQHPIGFCASSGDIWLQGHESTTRGHCSSTNGNQPMEGSLERKHLLEKGNKAPCQAWLAGHALLLKHSLRFYKDGEDRPKSQESVLSLDLTGARCTGAPDCGERPRCFCLRLAEGSQYLLSASSSSLMEEWMLRIQANTGSSEMDSSGHLSESLTSTQSPTSHCTAGDDITSSHSGAFHSCGARAKELIVLTGDAPHGSQRHCGILEDSPSPLSSDTGGHPGRSPPKPQDPPPCLSLSNSQEYPGNKQRSHSFTSATYQKITPAPLPHGIREGGSSYSVTLFIGDQPSGAPPPESAAESPTLIGQQREAPQGPDKTCGEAPKSQNKSVFKKFFGKERF
ncbi:hypothetical protein COCON_G00038720 [Conger conger]|uniref:PH domain-containing protein n=1 Tax=Conger conger TaxID=82655 RepID=A0A9Q1E056_CONCO|nr:hypothetical protein COCON_G00038720 [Conger conger]